MSGELTGKCCVCMPPLSWDLMLAQMVSWSPANWFQKLKMRMQWNYEWNTSNILCAVESRRKTKKYTAKLGGRNQAKEDILCESASFSTYLCWGWMTNSPRASQIFCQIPRAPLSFPLSKKETAWGGGDVYLELLKMNWDFYLYWLNNTRIYFQLSKIRKRSVLRDGNRTSAKWLLLLLRRAFSGFLSERRNPSRHGTYHIHLHSWCNRPSLIPSLIYCHYNTLCKSWCDLQLKTAYKLDRTYTELTYFCLPILKIRNLHV